MFGGGGGPCLEEGDGIVKSNSQLAVVILLTISNNACRGMSSASVTTGEIKPSLDYSSPVRQLGISLNALLLALEIWGSQQIGSY